MLKRDPRWRRRPARFVTVLAALATIFSGALSAQYQGWLIPDGGKDEKSPVAGSLDAARRGAAVFAQQCARCHGATGKGDGKDSDRAADLTDDLRTELNTEGILFYKVWNGHAIQLRTQVDDMPAFSNKLTRDQVWDLVEHLKKLRSR